MSTVLRGSTIPYYLTVQDRMSISTIRVLKPLLRSKRRETDITLPPDLNLNRLTESYEQDTRIVRHTGTCSVYLGVPESQG